MKIGPYEVDRRLSDRGGRARFVVQRTGLSSLCQLHLFATLPPTAQTQLREQLSACSRITHRALAATLEVGQEGGRIYVVREHIQGTPLSDLLLTDPPSAERAVKWALNAGEALTLLARSEVRAGKLDPEAIVLDGERLCLLEVGLSLERGHGGGYSDTAALARLLAHMLVGAPQATDVLPRRPKHVSSSLWRLLQATFSSPGPLPHFLGALRAELDGTGKPPPNVALPLWVAGGILLLTCVGAAILAASSTRTARTASRDLEFARGKIVDLDARIETIKLATAKVRARPRPPARPPPVTRSGPSQAQLNAWTKLHAATLEPRTVGKNLLVRWLRLFPQTPSGVELRARYCFYLGQPAQAVKDFQQASQGLEVSGPSAAMHAICLSSTGRDDEAQQVLSELSQREGVPEALWARGLLETGNPTERRRLVSEAARLAPNSPAVQQTVLGRPRPAPAGQRQALIDRWDELVRAHPAWEAGVYGRSHALYSHWAQSQPPSDELVIAFTRDLKNARDLSPNPMYWVYDAKSYLQTGRPWLALGPLEAAAGRLPAGNKALLAEFTTWHVAALALTGKSARAARELAELERLSPQAAEVTWGAVRQADPDAAEALERARSTAEPR